MIKIIALSDTHGHHVYLNGAGLWQSIDVPDGDILVCAGDFCSGGLAYDANGFMKWFATHPHPHKVLVAGNHDRVFESHPHLVSIPRSVTYLEDSGATIMGLKFWGSPVQPFFLNWAFNRTRGPQIKEHWDKIPKKVDVLITHGPPMGILDQSEPSGSHLGCQDLLDAVKRVKPLVHIFGHIHYSHGVDNLADLPTMFHNVAICNEDYKPVNPATEITITKD